MSITPDTQRRTVLLIEDNPEILTGAIEKNPEKIMEALQKASQ